MAWYLYPAVIAAGIAAGFINTVAGSGSLITIPVLIYVFTLAGYPDPAILANGTKRIGIFFQNIVSVEHFYRNGKLDVRSVLILGLPVVFGGILGAQIAVNMNEDLMRKSIGVVMLLMVVVILARPQRWLEGTFSKFSGKLNLKLILVFFAIGIYGGFIQAGIGIFLLAGLVLAAGFDLVSANGVKNGIILFMTIFALAIFIWHGQVHWGIGLLVSVGNMIGAWIGSRFAIEKGAEWVRRFLVIVVLVSAAQLLGLFELIGTLFS